MLLILDAHIDIVHLLVEANANVNLIVFYLFFYFQQDSTGKTPLHYASLKDRDGMLFVLNSMKIDVVQYLVAHNADMTIRDKEGNLPLLWMNSFKQTCFLTTNNNRI